MTTDRIREAPISISPEMDERVRGLANAVGLEPETVVEQALEVHLERLEVLARMEKGDRDHDAGRVIPHEKVVAWLDSLGTEAELDPPTWK